MNLNEYVFKFKFEMKGEQEFIDFLENLCKTRPEFLEMTPHEVIDALTKEKVKNNLI